MSAPGVGGPSSHPRPSHGPRGPGTGEGAASFGRGSWRPGPAQPTPSLIRRRDVRSAARTRTRPRPRQRIASTLSPRPSRRSADGRAGAGEPYRLQPDRIDFIDAEARASDKEAQSRSAAAVWGNRPRRKKQSRRRRVFTTLRTSVSYLGPLKKQSEGTRAHINDYRTPKSTLFLTDTYKVNWY